MTIEEIKNNSKFAKTKLIETIESIHRTGPVNMSDLEVLSYIKHFHPKMFQEYEQQLLYVLGLFYKTSPPKTFIERVYAIYAESIEDNTSRKFTPMQASAYKKIRDKKFFSFSAPTSSGKSFLFRELIQEYNQDIVIVLPSRALIAEYLNEIHGIVANDVLVLQFIENINTAHVKRRIYIITPERGDELFQKINELNIGLFLFDEAQISEEEVRGLRFDAFVRRVDRKFPDAKKVFTHPFINNPEAQLSKHQFHENSAAKNYEQNSVGKIYLSYKYFSNQYQYKYFSPFEDTVKLNPSYDIIEESIKQNGSLLIYISKNKIYRNEHREDFQKYIKLCKPIKDHKAKEIISEMQTFLGATSEKGERYSEMIDLMQIGIVIHHGSIPLKARLLIEKFVNLNFAKICFATSTLVQGINMPFDIVFIHNSRFGESGSPSLTLKNLIGRAGRTKSTKSFDFGYVFVRESFKNKLSEYLSQVSLLKTVSKLDENIENNEEDLKDIIESVKNDDFNIELKLPRVQVNRLNTEEVFHQVEFILNNFMINKEILTQSQYRALPKTTRDSIKEAFKEIYLKHLRKDTLSRAEKTVLSTAISILLWKIEGKSFSQIVSQRYAYLTEKDERRKIEKQQKDGLINFEECQKQIKKITIKFSQIAYPLPNNNAESISLFEKETSVLDCSYDQLIFDTYDYLDKVISQSLTDPLCAAFHLYYDQTKDSRALIMKNYIHYGTNDEVEIWLLKYGFEFDDIEWIKPYIKSIDQTGIEFSPSIKKLTKEQSEIIKRFIYN